MLNPNYQYVGRAVKVIDTKGKGIFNALRDFAIEMKATDHAALKEQMKTQEGHVMQELKVKLGANSTYKVAKGKVLKAIELGVSLTDKSGKPLGKTKLEEAIKSAESAAKPSADATPKAEVTPFDQFMVAITVAGEQAAKIEDKDIALAAGPVQALLEQLVKRIPMKAAA